MTMDLFAPKKSILLILGLAASCWLGCSAGTSAPPGSGSGNASGVGGKGSSQGGSTGFNVSGGQANNGGATSASSCKGTRCFVVDAGAYCGDGKISAELAETCDDGNRIGGDGCSGICKTESNWECTTPGAPCVSTIVCGNGLRQIGEGCDDNNKSPGDGCDAECNAEGGWYCAPSNPDDPASKSDCKRLANCGDERITAGETCDLGGANGTGQGCDANCRTEEGWVCRPPPVGCKHMSVCGNSKVEDGEQCDDGNSDAEDGCSSSCQIEASYYDCSTPGTLCSDTSQCGNGVLEKSEQCDDHNNDNDDGCTSDCTVEDGFQCRMAGQPCVPLCGDSIKVGGETCDDGNRDNKDGCSVTCTTEPGYTCDGTGPASCIQSICGDGNKDTSEACDCGNDPAALPDGCAGPNGLFYGDGSGCSKTCTKEPTCQRGNTEGCASVCGDGNLSGDEVCDDGNTFDRDGCSADCSTKEEGFECEDVTISDAQDCPSEPSLKCLVLPVVYRDFEGQNVTGGHPDFFYMGAAVTGGRTVGVTGGATKTTCMPNAVGTALPFTNGEQCPANDQSGACEGLTAATLDSDGKPVMAKNKCHCIFTDWDNTGILGACSGATCTPAAGLAGVETCWVDGSGDNHLRVEADVTVFQSADSFKQWYRDSDFSNKVVGQLELAATSGNLYQFSSSRPGDPAGSASRVRNDDLHDACLNNLSGTLNTGFFPLETESSTKICNITSYWMTGVASASDATCCAGTGCPVKAQYDPLASWDNCPTEGTGGMVPKSDGTGGKITGKKRNFYFTSEVRYLFRYDGKNATLQFNGDDDVWAFINGKLAIDLGGTHERAEKSVTINATTFSLTAGNTYEIAVFQAERGPVESNYQLTLSGFSTIRTQCGAKCGDGKITGGEECDLGPGKNTGEYGGCRDDCTYGPFCGDAEKTDDEECDDGKNTTVTSAGTDTNACGPGCKLPPRCGDGATQTGEECDDGVDGNTNDQCGGCNTECKLNPYCGDGNTDEMCEEKCDDGVNIGGYGYCTAECKPDSFCGDSIVDEAYGEKCDQGEENSDDPGAACNKRCGIPAICGDGVIQSPETCDDKVNDGAYGGCTVDCQLAAYCGDGAKNGDEECDYGDKNHGGGNEPLNSATYGSCLENCKLGPRCGDKVVQSPEQCDEGAANGTSGSLCLDECVVGGIG